MAKLARFTNGDKEFVVIFDLDDPDVSEFTDDGAELAEMVTITGDVSSFPTDRVLSDPVFG